MNSRNKTKFLQVKQKQLKQNKLNSATKTSPEKTRQICSILVRFWAVSIHVY